MTGLNDIEFIFTSVPLVWFRTYHKILELMVCYGERKIINPNCKCGGDTSIATECYELFQTAVAAYKLDKKEKGEEIIKYVESLLKGFDSAESFTATIDGKIYLFTKDNIVCVGGDSDNNNSIGVVNIPVTYSELKELKDNSLLIPNATYRITDYTTETVKPRKTRAYSIDFEKYVIGSAYHYFDLIVTATSKNTLDHNAKAIHSLRDTEHYFELSDLSKWVIKYDIENDETKYDWAVWNGKGVIYYMKDEYNNEAPYDFKNIIIKLNNNWVYTFNYTAENNFNYDSSLLYAKNNKIAEYIIDRMYLPYNIVIDDTADIVYDNSNNIVFDINSHHNVVQNSTNITIGKYCSENSIIATTNSNLDTDCNNITLKKLDNTKIGNKCYNVSISEREDYGGSVLYVTVMPNVHDVTLNLGQKTITGYVVKNKNDEIIEVV